MCVLWTVQWKESSYKVKETSKPFHGNGPLTVLWLFQSIWHGVIKCARCRPLQHCNSSLQRCCTVAAQDWAMHPAHTAHCLLSLSAGAHLVLHAGLPGPGLVPGHGGGVWRCGQYPGHCCAAYTATRATLLVPAETRPPWLLWCRTAQLYWAATVTVTVSRSPVTPGTSSHVTRGPAAKYSGAETGEMVSR